MSIEVSTKKQLEEALKRDPNGEIRITKGEIEITVRGPSRPLLIVLAGVWLSVTGADGAKPRIEARENSQVTARGNSQVTAWGNSQVTARGYAFVRVFSSRRIEAASTCIVAIHASTGAAGMEGVGGGHQVACPLPETPRAWCDHYGVEVRDDIAIVYKAVDQDYSTCNARPVGIYYTPGSTPSAPDWDGGKRECGGGLHFSPHPLMAQGFNGSSTAHYLACPIALADIAVHPKGLYPEKIKARGLAEPAYEVDQHGKPVVASPEKAA